MKSKYIVPAIVLYLIAGYVSLRSSSQPNEPCIGNRGSGSDDGDNVRGGGNSNNCLHPLIAAEDELSMELWTLWTQGDYNDYHNHTNTTKVPPHQIDARRRALLRWYPVESCRHDLTFPLTDSTIVFDATHGNCTLDLPPYSRRRGHEGGGPLKAKFVLKRISDGLVVASVPFELTRMVDLRQRPDDEGQPPISGQPPSASRVVSVPHFKYRGEPIVLRIVLDDQTYQNPPLRGDGVLMQLHQLPNDPRHHYRPLAYVDDAALRHSSKIEMASPSSNHTRPPINVRVRITVVSPMRDVIHRQVSMWMSMAEEFIDADDLDEIRYLINDMYIYRFVVTQLIGVLHVWIDYLAFRDEIAFYVGRTDMGGLSPSSVVSKFLCSMIIFLYLCEGGTSWLVLFSVGSGLVTEGWKAMKVLKPRVSPRFPYVVIRDFSRLSSIEKVTSTYDRIARTYLGLILYPLVAGSAFYAYKHYTYRSAWSWLISNLANAVYTYGFVGLCPQLYINYRLQSVSHMPWKCFVYKVFNTFVDDVFAVLIEMPLKHRIMTLRDDVVFVVFLVQMYIYRVDKSRVNEFGFSYEESGGTRDGDERVNGEQGGLVAEMKKEK